MYIRKSKYGILMYKNNLVISLLIISLPIISLPIISLLIISLLIISLLIISLLIISLLIYKDNKMGFLYPKKPQIIKWGFLHIK